MDKKSLQPRKEGSKPERARHAGRVRCWLKHIALGLVLLLAVVIALSALSNLLLPSRSATIEQLSDPDKARVLEALHLRRTLGDTLWPGWGSATIPLIQYNEQYA